MRVFGHLIRKLRNLNGQLFYYADEKPKGTPRETNTGRKEFAERENTAMQETLNRLATHADYTDDLLLVMMDQINEKSRKQRLPEMYAHILGRAAEHVEMRRILEPPMHIDSENSSNIQFADWVCALVKRAIDYQLVHDSRYTWIPSARELNSCRGSFTHESKLHLYERSISDLHHSEILRRNRPLFDGLPTDAQSVQNRQKLEMVRKATMRGTNS